MDAERPEKNAQSDRDHLRVQLLLRAGLALSVLLMVAGLAVRAAERGSDARAVRLFDIFAARAPASILTAAGILVLALTPAIRVVALVIIWWREKDWRFVGIAIAVTLTLGLAMIVGRG